MIITDGIARRVAALVATGDDLGLRAYVGHLIPKGRSAAPFRVALARNFTPAFMDLVDDMAPWLRDGSFGRLETAERIKHELAKVGRDGIARTALRQAVKASGDFDQRLDELEAAGEVRSGTVPTHGRPKTLYWLAENAPTIAASGVVVLHLDPFKS